MKVFLDASVMIAGVYSKTGGSAAIIELIARKKLFGFTSRTILKEVQRNISKKFSEEILVRYYGLIAQLPLTVLPEPKLERVRKYSKIIAPKDAHVLASFTQSKADYLVTLDQKDFKISSVLNAFPNKIVSPGELLKLIIG